MVFAPLTRRKHSLRTKALSGVRVSAPRSILCYLLTFASGRLEDSAVACIYSFSRE
jgi:hypothetical protein